MPSAFALMSSSAFSMAPIACCKTTPAACRRTAYINVTSASYAVGSLPRTWDPSPSITAETPSPPNDSLYSLQPTRPSSVEILRKSKLRCPASACRCSSLVIFMARYPSTRLNAIVDAHHHFWDLTQRRHPWLTDAPLPAFRYGDYAALRRSYLPDDYGRDTA